MNILEKQALKFILKHTQEEYTAQMQAHAEATWAAYRNKEIDFDEVKQRAKAAKKWLKPESVVEITAFVKKWGTGLQ